MVNVIMFDFIQKEGYHLQNLIDAFETHHLCDNTQGIIINEYSETFLKATYWHKKMRKGYRFNLEEMNFDTIEEEVISVADFEIQIEDKKLLVFGNKQMAQRIVTLIGIVSKNAYLITEFIISVKGLVKKIRQKPDIKLIRMKLSDITIEKGVMVSCMVNLLAQDDPKELAFKYVDNIVTITFRLKNVESNITAYKSGKFSISKLNGNEKDELIDSIIQIVR